MLSTGCRQAAIILILFRKSSFESHVACITAKKMHMFEPVNLQVLLTNLCQDSSLDIVLRLQLLEVIFSKMRVLLLAGVFRVAGDRVAQSWLEEESYC